MRTVRTAILFTLFLLLSAAQPASSPGADQRGRSPGGAGAAAAAEEYLPMPAPGQKVPLGEGHYLIYGFDQKPKRGKAMLKVQVFTAAGKRDTSLEIRASADMPLMRGAHPMAERPFELSGQGDYLLPIPIIMTGQWEVRFRVFKQGKVIFRGSYTFNV